MILYKLTKCVCSGGMANAPQHTRQRMPQPLFIQPSGPGYPHPANPQFYRPATLPLCPPPYSSLQPPPPPYNFQGLQAPPSPQMLKAPLAGVGAGPEKDEGMAMTLIRPMQPAYIMPSVYGPLVNPPYSHPPYSSQPPAQSPMPTQTFQGPPPGVVFEETRHM